MDVFVKSRDGKPLATLTASKNTSVYDLKKQFQEASNSRYYPERVWFTLNDPKGEALKDNSQTLEKYNVSEGDTLYFKDLGMQISWRLVFVIEYLGPILTFCFFYSQPSFIYGKSAVGARPTERDLCTQQLAFWLVIGHYAKRELESAFVHRFSNATMPFNRIFINSSHYNN